MEQYLSQVDVCNKVQIKTKRYSMALDNTRTGRVQWHSTIFPIPM